eukprot:6477508-Amphidinium_carterae.1
MLQRLHTDFTESTHQLQRHQQVLAQGIIDIRSHMDTQFQVLSAQVGALQRSEQLDSIADNMSLVAAGHQDFYIDFVDQRERWTRKFAELHAAITPSVPPTQDYERAPLQSDQPQEVDRKATTPLTAAPAQVIDSDNEEKESEVNRGQPLVTRFPTFSCPEFTEWPQRARGRACPPFHLPHFSPITICMSNLENRVRSLTNRGAVAKAPARAPTVRELPCNELLRN